MATSVFIRFISLLLFCISTVVLVISGNDEVGIGELPFCNPSNLRTEDEIKKLVFVSTLDGKLSALDALSGGLLSWDVNTGQGPMLSSSIHRLELTNQGQWVRMIPSLSGGLYRFNGESIEAVPVTADNLLQSSGYLFSDNLVIAGGRETSTYGVDVRSGRLMYECSMSNCRNFTDDATDTEEVLVVQRLTQTVRAVEARSGSERWNFSVAQHDVKMVMNPNSDCHGGKQEGRSPAFDFVLKIIVPEGLVCAFSKANPSRVVWKYKFDAPVVSAWQYAEGSMLEVDLFSGSHWRGDDLGVGSPPLYIGMHNKQLYIQESVMLQRRKALLESRATAGDPGLSLRIPWHPVPVTSTALGLPDGSDSNDSSDDHDTQLSTTAMSVLYASSYVNGNGYYLFSENDLSDKHGQCRRNVTIAPVVSPEDSGGGEEGMFAEDTPAQIIIVSIWYYWKEVVIISFSTALLVNLLYRKVYVKELKVVVVEKPVIVTEDTDSGIDQSTARSQSIPGQLPAVPEFTSRYLTDFEPVRCLGKGGFGVVFEAKNKIDDWSYAVKRIALPNRPESRDRVMREVRALAKLDHQHIVRYFNAWLECPPPGWQEQQDKLWPPSISTSCSLEEVTSMDPVKPSKATYQDKNSSNAGFLLNLRSTNNIDDSLIHPHVRSKKGCRSLDISDSFITFESPEEQEEECDRRHSVITLNSNSSESNSKTKWKKHSNSNEMKQVVVKRPFSLDVGSGDGGRPVERMFLFIQMQLCREESLREWLKDNVESRDPATVHGVFLQILDAVEYVHLQGLIHRDLKPSNIFFSLDGQIKVGDFGLVTAMVEGSCDQTPCAEGKTFLADEKHTAQVGTQLYMSPEQSKGLPYNYKVDIYSLGVILFELLVPFRTEMERVTTLTKARSNKLPPQFQLQFKEEFDLLQMMLSHNPDERPTTYGIRARPPFNQQSAAEWHFELPSRRRTSSTNHSTSSSADSNVDQR
ncbi:eukaryotic translation initiation factor 2-alpha kinase [Bacillus rossius redtenbacheri]|uniref:eukaryotic translation initiation factor 2-alpha kinase n=1 Tax=Bacillus rossius redtenbacheri TaxID=93214 RepID=UPI002FDC88A6